MKLLFVNESLRGGGAERQLSVIANGFAAAGHDVTVATWTSRDVGDVYPLDPRISRLHLRRRERGGHRAIRVLGNLHAFARLVAHIIGIRPTAVVSFSEASNVLTVKAGRIARSPTVVSLRTNPGEMFRLKPHWYKFAVAAYSRAGAVVAQTQSVADWCEAHCRRRAQVIPNLLRALPAARPIDARSPVVVSVGSLIDYKGHDVLIRAFAAIRDAHPDWRLVILGEGPERARLEKLASDLRVADKVELRGFAGNIETALNDARIFAFPSRFEGFPNALVEAMGMGLACVSSDCDFGPREIIADGEDGLLFPVDDEPALSTILDRLMSDGSLRQRLSQRAQAINDRYTPQRVLALWDEAIRGASRQAS